MKRAAHLALVAIVAVSAIASARADDGLQLIEQKIKAGLIYNFLKYTQWPAGSPRQSGNLSVCFFGGDPFEGNLQPMSGRTVNERTIEVRGVASLAELKSCALVIVHSAKRSEWPQIASSLGGQDIITVSDFDGFADAGGMIEFTHVGNRVGVKINEEALSANHLVVQDRLLKLADAVRSAPSAPR